MSQVYRAVSVHCIARYLLDGGAPPGQLLRDLRLPPQVFFDSSIWVERDTVFDMVHGLIDYSGDPLAVIRSLDSLQLSDFGDFSSALNSSASVREALRYLCLNISRLETGTRLTLHGDGAWVRLRSRFVGRLDTDPYPLYEGLLLMLSKVLRLAAEPFEIRFRLPHPAHDVAALEKLLDSPVEFNCPHAEMVFPAEVLDQRLSGAELPRNPDWPKPAFTCREVNKTIEALLEYERPTAALVADSLSLNVRSMQRHLSVWGITFEELLDNYRQRRAVEYLLNERYSITDMAQRLGYSEGAHFTRAFKRWYGVPPSRFSEQLRPDPAQGRVCRPL